MIAVIVLNWNRPQDTLECLKSVYDSNYPHYSVYVADNGSTDDSISQISDQFPQARIVANKANLGFAEGNNRAIVQALADGAEYIFLLNNDAVVCADTLSLLHSSMQANPQAAAIGPKIYYFDHPTRIWYAGASFDPKTAHFNHNDFGIEEAEAPLRSTEPTGYVCGCAFFARSASIRQIGLMDPRYFLNWEEIDWCARFRKSGYECLYDPTPKVWHKIGSSFPDGKRGPTWLYYYYRNRLLWLEKHIPFSQRLPIYLKYIIPELRHIVKTSPKSESRAIFRATLDYLLRRFGPAQLK